MNFIMIGLFLREAFDRLLVRLNMYLGWKKERFVMNLAKTKSW